MIDSLLIVLMLAPMVLLWLYLYYLQFQYLNFKKQVPEFRTPQDIESLKELAAFQMRGVPIGLKIMNYFPIMVWFTGINTGHLGWQDLLYYVITPWLILGAYCFATGSPPVKIGQYPVLNQELTEQRDHIVHVWIHETHPDW